jgi:flavodoxin I
MKKITVIYGSTTGNTERAAKSIAAALGGKTLPIAQAQPGDFEADLVVLGTSTWGIGELQDDWSAHLDTLRGAALSGRDVALFGLGDQQTFSTSYVDAMGILGEEAEARGAHLVGAWPANGYRHDASRAIRNGMFIGLALDDDNEFCLTAGRIAAWCSALTNPT